MKFLMFLSDFIMPLLIFYIVGYGLLNHRNIYDDFVQGAAEGLKIVVKIAPTLIGLLVAVGVLRASGVLDTISRVVSQITDVIHFPSPLVPLVFIRLFSSSAATGFMLDIFKEYGTDSYIGLITSILMSCTETVFYTMSVYFVAAKITKTRYTLKGALLATVAGITASVILAGMMTGVK